MIGVLPFLDLPYELWNRDDVVTILLSEQRGSCAEQQKGEEFTHPQNA